MDYIQLDGGRGNRQVKPRHVYPVWGMEVQPRTTDARRHYRNGDVCAWCRYIVKPRDGLLWYGWTVGDTIVTAAVVALLAPLALLAVGAVGAGFDGYLSAAGY